MISESWMPSEYAMVKFEMCKKYLGQTVTSYNYGLCKNQQIFVKMNDEIRTI